MTNNLKRAIDTDLSGLRLSQQQRADLLENALEGKKVKKKLSLAFMLVITLLLIAAAALAFSISQHYFEGIAQLEAKHGYYDEWSLSEKIDMLNLMKEYDVISDSAEVDALLNGSMGDAERETQIDAFMSAKYGINGRTDVITLAGILQQELGDMHEWTQEQKVWYSQLMIENGIMGTDEDIYQMPLDSDVQPDEAIAIARTEIMRAWALSDDDLAGYTATWEFRAHVTEKDNAYYDIKLSSSDDGQRSYYCSIGRDGRLLTSEDALGASSPDEQKSWAAAVENECDQEARALYQQYATEHGFNKPVGEPTIVFEYWPLEHQKAFTDLVRPIVQQNMAENPNYADWSYAFYATHYYGLPDENAVQQDAAQATAYAALTSHLKLPDALVAYCDDVYCFYDVTEPDKPLWKFFFSANKHWNEVEAMGVEPGIRYRILIDACTGEIVDALAIHHNESLTGLAYVELIR